MYCLINVEQKGKFLSIYFNFIFSFWFFALGSGSTILRLCPPYMSPPNFALPRKNWGKNGCRSQCMGTCIWSTSSPDSHQYGVEIISLILYRKRPRFGVNLRKHNLVPRALFTGPPPKPGKSALGMRLEQEPLCSWLEETCKKRKLVCMHFCHVLPCEQRFLSCMAFTGTAQQVFEWGG